jgi:hypothetical protein
MMSVPAGKLDVQGEPMKISLAAQLCLLAGLFAGHAAANAAPAAPSLRIDGDTVTAVDASGRAIWKRQVALPLPLQAESLGDGNYRINRSLRLDRFGRRIAAPAALPTMTTLSTYTWQEPQLVLDAYSLQFIRPVFDKDGNVWTVVTDYGSSKSRVMKYVTKKQIWKQVRTLPLYFGSGHMDVDAEGNLTIVGMELTADHTSLNAVRYEPATGWSGPLVIYSTPPIASAYVIYNFDVASDDLGNAIVVADEFTLHGISIVYSKALQAWQPLQTVPVPANFFGDLGELSVTRSPNRRYLELAYIAATEVAPDTDRALGYYVSSFDSATLKFDAPVVVPKSIGLAGHVEYGVGAGGGLVKLAVDNGGDATLVWDSGSNVSRAKLGVYGSRREAGVWVKPVRLNAYPVNIEDFWARIDVDNAGRVIAGTVSGISGESGGQYIVFKYLPGSGWSTDQVAAWSDGGETDSSLTWFGDGQAVCVYFVYSSNGDGQFSGSASSIYDGSSWGPITPLPPGDITSTNVELAKSDSGKPILLLIPIGDELDQFFYPVAASFMNVGP